MNIQEKIAKRQQANREIVKIISEVVERYPDWRFAQILFNIRALKNTPECPMGTIPDPYHIESVDMLDTIVREYLGIDEN